MREASFYTGCLECEEALLPMRLFSQKKMREVRPIIMLGVFLTLLVAGTQFSSGYARQLLDRLDLLIYDLRFNLLLPYSHKTAAAQRIVIIDIDERSLKEVGHWPWSRKTVAELVDKLAAAGVVSITFDVVFSEPEPNMATEIAAVHAAIPIAADLRQLAPQFDYDRRMAESISKIDVTLGYILHGEGFRTGEMPASHVDLAPELVQRSSVEHMVGHTTNIPVLQQTARGQGFINGPPDSDGIVRRAPLMLRYGDQLFPSLALQTAMTYLLLDSVTPTVINDGSAVYVQSIELGDKLIHTDGKGQMTAAQHRMTDVLDIKVRPAEPARKEHVQFVLRGLQLDRVQGTNRGELGNAVHQFVEAIAKPGQRAFATDQLVRSLLLHGCSGAPDVKVETAGVVCLCRENACGFPDRGGMACCRPLAQALNSTCSPFDVRRSCGLHEGKIDRQCSQCTLRQLMLRCSMSA